ncbi:MAG: radical SAM protein [Nanoarchaeota archaeon]|nr:radical SAM protein [Nanoarchaeota archaeon]
MTKSKRLDISLSNCCQLRCPKCPSGRRGFSLADENEYMKFEDFRSLLDGNPQIKEVLTNCRGEMFLNPDLLQIMEYAFKKGVAMGNSCGVNLNNVNEGVLEGLVKYRFRLLLCSLDGASPETYSTYRIGGDFNKVIEHIRTINHFKKTYKSEYPKLIWQFIVFGYNEHEIDAAKEMARELNMEFSPKMQTNPGQAFSSIRNREMVMKKTGWSVTTREEFAEKTGSEYIRSVCHSLWLGPRVDWDGTITGCGCFRKNQGAFGGNALVDGYLSAITHEKIEYAKKMLLGQEKPKDNIPCTTCQLYLDMRNSKNFLTLKEIFQSPLPEYKWMPFSCKMTFLE